MIEEGGKNRLIFSTAHECEIAFYKAFAECKPARMREIWYQKDPVCVHPGSTALTGFEIIIKSWYDILANSHPPDLKVTTVSVTKNDSLAVHFVEELIGRSSSVTEGGGVVQGDLVLATNVFIRSDKGWKIVEHHASSVPPGSLRSKSHNQTLH